MLSIYCEKSVIIKKGINSGKSEIRNLFILFVIFDAANVSILMHKTNFSKKVIEKIPKFLKNDTCLRNEV